MFVCCDTLWLLYAGLVILSLVNFECFWVRNSVAIFCILFFVVCIIVV